jgi:hypothetical protein
VLRQTLIVLTAGHKPDEHDNPASLPCTCCTGGHASRGTSAGKEALEDSAVLLTVAKHS